MPPPSVPDEVLRLLDERTAARAARDWAGADELRDRIAALGWEVEDAAGGSTVRPRLPAEPSTTGYAEPSDLASRLDEPATVAASVQLVAEDHPDDLRRALAGLAAHPSSVAFELVVVANAPAYDLAEVLSATPSLDPVVLGTRQRLGWADARTLGLRRSTGEVTVVLDTSLEPTGDFVAPAACGLRRLERRPRRPVGRHKRRRSIIRGGAAGRGRRDRGLLPGRPARGAADRRRLRPALSVLSKRRSRLQLRRPRCRLARDPHRAAAAGAPRAPRLDLAARRRTGSAQQAQLLSVPGPMARPARPPAAAGPCGDPAPRPRLARAAPARLAPAG